MVMRRISYARHRFPSEVICHAVWLYLRFTLSYRDVEDLLAERGLGVSYETVRRWVLKFGPLFAKDLRCPSSDDLRQFGCFRKGGSGSSVVEIKRHAGDAANDDLRWS